MRDPIIAQSAQKHGLAAADIQHAYRNPIRVWDLGEGFTMVVGPAPSGALLEVGFVQAKEAVVIIHAMSAREKFLR